MAVKLLGIGEGTFDGLLPALVDTLALAMGIGTLGASAQTWRVISRVALRLDVHEARSGQLLQIAESLL